MAARDKIYLDNQQEVIQFKAWLTTAPKKIKKIIKKRSYAGVDCNGNPWGVIRVNAKISKSLSRCNLPWLKEKIIEDFFLTTSEALI